jgi:hypothetical protein
VARSSSFQSAKLNDEIISFRLIELPENPIVKFRTATLSSMELEMSVITTLRSYVAMRRAAFHRRRTAELVNALPPDIQKDIGWPGFFPDERSDARSGGAASVAGKHRRGE